MKNKVKNEQLNTLTVSGWFLFKEFMPELNQNIEIYWSTNEITKQIWKNDIVWTSNEIPMFFRAAKIMKRTKKIKTMTKEDLRIEFEKKYGINWLNSQGEPDIDYVEWLEDFIINKQPTDCKNNER